MISALELVGVVQHLLRGTGGGLLVQVDPPASVDPPAPGSGVPDSPNFWMPNAASEIASSVDSLFSVVTWISVISTVGVVAAIVYFCVRFRAGPRSENTRALSQADHSNTLEITWSVIPLFIVVGLFVAGFRQFASMRIAPRAAYEVHATAQKWKWGFEYPEGLRHPELHVPVGRNVRVVIQSVDVLHSLFLPEFRVKMDAVPGRYTELWFKSDSLGNFPIYCTEYCGTSHSDMLSRVVVHDQQGFEAWVAEEIRKIESMPLAELGELTYNQSGCATCHSLDGSQLVGPSFKGLFGKDEVLVGGTVKVDENYIRESILEPQAQIVQGYPPAMPTYKGQLSDRRLSGLIEFIKGVK